MEELKWLTSLGIGGVLAGMIFFFYRRDFVNERSKHSGREDKMIEVIERNAVAGERLSETVKDLQSYLRSNETERMRQFQALIVEAKKQ